MGGYAEDNLGDKWATIGEEIQKVLPTPRGVHQILLQAEKLGMKRMLSIPSFSGFLLIGQLRLSPLLERINKLETGRNICDFSRLRISGRVYKRYVEYEVDVR